MTGALILFLLTRSLFVMATDGGRYLTAAELNSPPVYLREYSFSAFQASEANSRLISLIYVFLNLELCFFCYLCCKLDYCFFSTAAL